MPEHQVYIIQSLKTGRFYTGVSAKFNKRLYFHNKGLNISTRVSFPWIKVWISEPIEKDEASFLERRIKKRGAKRFLQDLESRDHA